MIFEEFLFELLWSYIINSFYLFNYHFFTKMTYQKYKTKFKKLNAKTQVAKFAKKINLF